MEHRDVRLALPDLVVPGLADPERAAALRAHLAGCAECRAELEELRRLDARLRAAGPLPAVGADLERRVLALTRPASAEARPASDERPPTAPAPAARARRRHGAGLLDSVWTWRGVAALAVLVLVLALGRRDGGPSYRTERTLPLRVSRGETARGRVVLLAAPNGREAVRIDVSGLGPPRAGTLYELWLSRSPTNRVSLGVVQPDDRGRIRVQAEVPRTGRDYHGVWLTRERDDGNPAWSRGWVAWARIA